MDYKTKQQLIATGKMVLGVGRIGSGLMTAMGKGLVGAYCLNHGMTRAAASMAQASLEGGAKSIKDGWKEWNEARG